jgi:hypothetical protein
MILTNGGLTQVGSIQLNQPMAICFWVPPYFNMGITEMQVVHVASSSQKMLDLRPSSTARVGCLIQNIVHSVIKRMKPWTIY